MRIRWLLSLRKNGESSAVGELAALDGFVSLHLH
jgi:hypothetical protein